MENYLIANCTDTGKVRTINEDSMTTFDSPNGRVVVVCDGMGGQNAGDVASQLAVAVIQDILTDNKFSTPEEAISKSIMAANQAILLRSSQNHDLAGMGATCVMLIINDGKVYYGSVGDSRIYYISRDSIRQLTKDQSYVQTLVDAGEITQEAAEHHKDKNQITNALGLEGMTPPVVSQMPITPEPGSSFLLCSDGLSGMISNNVMRQVVSKTSRPLNERAKELVTLANNAGGLDNITVQLVEFPQGGNSGAYNASRGSGVNKPVKAGKNKAMAYWIAAIAVVLLGIGVVTYFMIDDTTPKPKLKTNVTIKTQPQEESTPKTQPQESQQASNPTQSPAAGPQVKVVEKKRSQQPESKSKKQEKKSKLQKLEEEVVKQEQPKPEEDINKAMKKVNNPEKE